MVKFSELLSIGEKELTEKVVEAKQELAKERAAIASGTRSENPGKIRKLRRDIAKILTALKQKQTSKGKTVEQKKEVKKKTEEKKK